VGRYSIKEGNLTIINIQEEDRGWYQCSATNKAATITAEAELLVENIPSNAPSNLTAVSSSASVHLTWLPGRQRTNVEYSVWYKPVGSSEWKTHQVTSSRTLEATITGLNSGICVCTLKLLSQHSYQAENMSSWFFVKTTTATVSSANQYECGLKVSTEKVTDTEATLFHPWDSRETSRSILQSAVS
jgi:hypothetical protein